jgi:hypothetical protein
MNWVVKMAYYMLDRYIVLAFVDKLAGLLEGSSDDAAMLGLFVCL